MTYYDQKIKEIDDELESIAASTEERTTEQRDRLNQLRSRRKLIERLKTNYTQLPLFAVEDDVREQIDYNALVGCQGSCEEDRDLWIALLPLLRKNYMIKPLATIQRNATSTSNLSMWSILLSL